MVMASQVIEQGGNHEHSTGWFNNSVKMSIHLYAYIYLLHIMCEHNN